MDPNRKPPTIAELAEEALDNLWDESRELKYYLRMAEKYRNLARQHVVDNDLESAFVMFAKAATLVLEKIPTHRDFARLLNAVQRNNLTLNGQEMLTKMSEIKPILIDRLMKWNNEHATDEIDARGVTIRWADENNSTPRPGIPVGEGERMIAEEKQKWDEYKAARAQESEDDRREAAGTTAATRTAAPVAETRRAARGLPQLTEQHKEYILARRAERAEAQRVAEEERRAQELNQRRREYVATRRAQKAEEQEHLRQQQQQDEMRHREEEISRRREMKRQEISQRQQEADNAAHTVLQTIAVNNPGVTVAPTPALYHNQPSTSAAGLQAQPNGQSRPPSLYEPPRLPLESPAQYETDSTDSEAPGQQRQFENSNTPTRAPPARSPIYPPPITTTSPPPVEGARVQYPQLMSQHQKRQGYHPSENSMFIPPGLADHPPAALYPNHLLSRTVLRLPTPQELAEFYADPSRPAPPLPRAPPSTTHAHTRTEPERIPRTMEGLRQVNLPRDCLPRFLTIAKANTTLNLETCGLLLGKDRGSKFVVTTLLIPKQHATSDTCTMDEEELVLQFTEERGLITLGWIHTHPSQSCFMSSVDLHTHSGFQRMLPESFAVVCAPKSNPNFGIFRLTDPPGLKTVLDCKAKEAFHPHPDLPIYTDADKGHVQMKDLKLEIVDLR
ncbi:hypothetical protein H0H81_006831 [Sphagnurus paluster]|uniref:MPN domain-containing protein n=1 Tax=Sphagnurus paluster TaxID=117069 RepID=A0A9P7GJT9_9AGAR|nr:hypothetical protein H0H81_006831 [Sphagnurus paluster]